MIFRPRSIGDGLVLGVVIGAPRTLACASLPRVAVISAPGPDSVLVASMVVVNALAASPVTEKMPWGGAAQSPDTAGDATNAGRGNGDGAQGAGSSDGAVVQSGGLSDGHWDRDLGAGVTGNSFGGFTGHKEIGCGEDRSCDY